MYVPSSELGLPQPLSRKQVCPLPPDQRVGGGLKGWGSPNLDDRRKSLTLCLLCAEHQWLLHDKSRRQQALRSALYLSAAKWCPFPLLLSSSPSQAVQTSTKHKIYFKLINWGLCTYRERGDMYINLSSLLLHISSIKSFIRSTKYFFLHSLIKGLDFWMVIYVYSIRLCMYLQSSYGAVCTVFS